MTTTATTGGTVPQPAETHTALTPLAVESMTTSIAAAYGVTPTDPQFVLTQMMKVAEEAGEVLGAYLRMTGMSRRTGTTSEYAAELADVLCSSHIAAYCLGELPMIERGRTTMRPGDDVMLATWTPTEKVAQVAATAGWALDRYLLGHDPNIPAWTLGRLVLHTHIAAESTGVDLDAAVADKLAVIFSRGWKNP